MTGGTHTAGDVYPYDGANCADFTYMINLSIMNESTSRSLCPYALDDTALLENVDIWCIGSPVTGTRYGYSTSAGATIGWIAQGCCASAGDTVQFHFTFSKP